VVNFHGVARLGVLAVGLGIGAAWAQMPVASADSSSDWLSTIDSLLSGASPAPATPIDLFISFDGYTIYDGGGGADAITVPGDYSVAIAYGADADAFAFGTGSSSYADGSGAYAYTGGGTGDVAEALGTNAYAVAGGDASDTGANYDTAIDIGNNDLPSAAGNNGAYAGNGDLAGGTGTGAYDTAIDIGNNTNDLSEGINGDNGAFAGAGALSGGSGDGNNDTAINVGNNSGFGDGATSDEGNGNYAGEFGSIVGEYDGTYSGTGNDNTAINDVSYNTNFAGINAENGNDNYAFALGPENSGAVAGYGDSNIVYILDPLGSTPISVTSGYGGNSDLAAVLWTDGNALASSADHVYDILTASGHEAGIAAATSGGFLGELLSLF